MIPRVGSFLKTHKTLFVSMGFLVLFSFAVSYAAPMYAPGQTLDPQCVPGSTDCTVALKNSQWDDVNGGINYAGGMVGIGTASPSTALEVNGMITSNSLHVKGDIVNSGILAPTNLQGAIVYESTPYIAANGYSFNVRVYAYKTINGVKTYSATYATLPSNLVDDSDHSHYDALQLSWDTVSGVEGYRVLFYFGAGTTAYWNYSYYLDTTATSLTTNLSDVTTGNTVTPNSGRVYGDVSTIEGPLSLQGDVDLSGTVNVSGNFINSIKLGTSSIFNTDTSQLGIGTVTPRASLDLSGDGSFIATGTHGSGIDVPNLGAGTRLMWIPKLAAFRVGNTGVAVGADYWDSSNIGDGSIALGQDLLASGRRSFATGTQSIASGDFSTAMGIGSEASGVSSVSVGEDVTASGDHSVAIGFNTDAESIGSIAVGVVNIGGGDPSNWISTDPLFEVGNGDYQSGDKSDAIMVLKNGYTGIALNPTVNGGKPQYALQVGSSAITGVVARFQNGTGTCDINPTSSSLTCSSDMRLKKNITNLSDSSAWSFNNNITTANQSVLARILALNPVNYNWNAESDTTTKHPGFIAQEVQEVFPDLVATDPNTGLLSLNYTGLIPYTVQAIKEMNVTLKALPTYADPTLTQNIATFLAGIAERGEAVVNKVTTKQLCLNSTCLTEDQLKSLLQLQQTLSANGSSTTVSNPPVDNSNTSDSSDQGNTQTPAVTEPVIVPDSVSSGAPADNGANNSVSDITN